MANRPLKPCAQPGCRELVSSGRCEKHRKQATRDYDSRRGTAHDRGYTSRWQKAREWHLRRHPLCAECERQGRITAASVVDHIKPHKGDRSLFWDESNWQALCKRCHDIKTVKEDGGFGCAINRRI